MKRRIALFLALVMILAPLTAFAAPTFTGSQPRDVRSDSTNLSSNITVTFDRNDFKNLPAGVGNYFHLRVNLKGARIDTNAPANGAVVLNPDRVFVAGDLAPVVLPGANDLSTRTDGQVSSFFIRFQVPQNIDDPANLDVKPNFTIEMTGLRITASSGEISADLSAFGVDANTWNASEALFGSSLTNIKNVPLFNIGEGKVDLWMHDTKHITRGHHWNDTGGIWFRELRLGAWGQNSRFKLELPRGFHWDTTVDRLTFVPHSNNQGVTGDNEITVQVYYEGDTGEGRTNRRVAIIDLGNSNAAIHQGNLAARLDNEVRTQVLLEGLKIMGDRQVAENGPIVAKVTTDRGVTSAKSELTVGIYGQEEVTMNRVGDVKEVYAGRTNVELNQLQIKETIWGTIGTNRTIELILPEGVKWMYDESNYVRAGWEPQLENDTDDLEGLEFRGLGGGVTQDGTIAWYFADRNRQRIVATVVYESAPMNQDPRTEEWGGGDRAGADIIFENLRVAIDPQFANNADGTFGKDIEVEVEVAGWSETIVLGRAVPAVTVSMDDYEEVQLGLRNQPIGDIVIEEWAPGAIRRTDGANDLIEVWIEGTQLSRHKFNEVPVATVLYDGPIKDAVQIERVWMSPDRDTIFIQIEDRGVNSPSTIVLSGLELTIDRTAPEGPIEIFIGGGAIIDTTNFAETNIERRVDSSVNFFRSIWLHRFNLAEVITPADRTVLAETVTFVVGQSSYTVGGRTVAMDASPYNKDGRVMLPARFVANALGIADENVVWDQASQTVSVFVNDWTAQMTVGSNVAHGRQTLMMDVAPENINGRVYVPMRFLANLMGVDNADITWNQAAQSVTFY